MPEYTPTTGNIRDCYVYSGQMYDGSVATSVSVAVAEFDRWLKAHDREVAARALEDLAEHDGDWTARAWRPQEAETVVKMRKAILARAAAIRSGTEGGTDV